MDKEKTLEIVIGAAGLAAGLSAFDFKPPRHNEAKPYQKTPKDKAIMKRRAKNKTARKARKRNR